GVVDVFEDFVAVVTEVEDFEGGGGGVAVVVEVDVAAGALVVDGLAVAEQVTAFGEGGALGAFGAGDIGQVGDVLGRFDRSCGFGGQRDRDEAVVDVWGVLENLQVGFELGESFVEVGVVGVGGPTGGTGDECGVIADGGTQLGVVEAVGDVDLLTLVLAFQERGKDLGSLLEGDEGDRVGLCVAEAFDDGAEVGCVRVVGLAEYDLDA